MVGGYFGSACKAFQSKVALTCAALILTFSDNVYRGVTWEKPIVIPRRLLGHVFKYQRNKRFVWDQKLGLIPSLWSQLATCDVRNFFQETCDVKVIHHKAPRKIVANRNHGRLYLTVRTKLSDKLCQICDMFDCLIIFYVMFSSSLTGLVSFYSFETLKF